LRLDCGRCVFRPWREGDEPSLARHADNYEVWRRLRDRFPHPYTHADTEQWIASARQQDPQTSFAIEARGEAVGGIGLELGSDIERRSAEIGYWLGESFWGKGIATDAARAMTGYGFEALGLTRVSCRAFCEQLCVDTRPGEMRLHSREDNAPERDQRGRRGRSGTLRPDRSGLCVTFVRGLTERRRTKLGRHLAAL
jgi:GNAT acetyltransferase-like protein